MEERMDQLQADMQTSHRMLQAKLGSFFNDVADISVDHGLQEQEPEPQRELRPMGFNTFTKGPPLGTLGGLEALRLVPPEMPQAINSALDAFNSAASKPANSVTPKPSVEKKSGTLTAVPETSLPTENGPESDLVPSNSATDESSAQPPTQLQRRIMKIVQLSKLKPENSNSSDDDEILRRFSVSSMNLTRSAGTVRRRKNNIFNEKQGAASVSPEEILNARNLEGEVQPYTLRHNSQYRLAWDMLVMVIILLDIVFTPLSLGFNYDAKFLDFYNIWNP
ncbi:hypothetical protein GQ600_25740 [Phytophthora cactorum]|nr:hypothetical protein GQ600_25740 [Phytophthora cactorum]